MQKQKRPATKLLQGVNENSLEQSKVNQVYPGQSLSRLALSSTKA